MSHEKLVITCMLALQLGFLSPHAISSTSTCPAEIAGLGQVHFANSCSSDVQGEFDAAVAMLHSFQYGLAEKTFADVAQRDPECAIAYWGAAMTLYHPLWDAPTGLSLQNGREYLLKARRLTKKSAREAAYLHAAEAFYQPVQRLGSRSRAQAYSDAMRRLHQRYPNDDDATAFYALTLLAWPAEGAVALAHQHRAIQILAGLFSSRPDHPGAAHYLIHATDTAELAPLGLEAARGYARIAPSSPHAVHMPSHIFARLGMWQDSIASNLASISAAQESSRSYQDDGSGDELHAMMYLEYSYLQSGDAEAARRVIDNIQNVPGATPSDIINNRAIFQALYAVETHDWQKAATLPVDPSAFPYARLRTYWARVIGAARTGDIHGARQNLAELDQARARMVSYIRGADCQMHSGHPAKSASSVQQLEARAWLAWAEGKSAEAVNVMRAAARKEESYGVESRSVPAYEMLGDLLFELNKPDLARDAYFAALQEAPLRFNALAGAARAARAAGKTDEARSYYAILMKCCSPRAQRKEVGEAKSFLSGN